MLYAMTHTKPDFPLLFLLTCGGRGVNHESNHGTCFKYFTSFKFCGLWRKNSTGFTVPLRLELQYSKRTCSAFTGELWRTGRYIAANKFSIRPIAARHPSVSHQAISFFPPVVTRILSQTLSGPAWMERSDGGPRQWSGMERRRRAKLGRFQWALQNGRIFFLLHFFKLNKM